MWGLAVERAEPLGLGLGLEKFRWNSTCSAITLDVEMKIINTISNITILC